MIFEIFVLVFAIYLICLILEAQENNIDKK